MIDLFLLFLFFLLGEQQGQDDGRQRSSMLSSPTPSHYFISLLLIPHQLSGFNLPWCLVLTKQNCAFETECVLVFWTLRFAYTLHQDFEDCRKDEINSHKLVQEKQHCTYLKCSPQWLSRACGLQYSHSGTSLWTCLVMCAQ